MSDEQKILGDGGSTMATNGNSECSAPLDWWLLEIKGTISCPNPSWQSALSKNKELPNWVQKKFFLRVGVAGGSSVHLPNLFKLYFSGGWGMNEELIFRLNNEVAKVWGTRQAAGSHYTWSVYWYMCNICTDLPFSIHGCVWHHLL